MNKLLFARAVLRLVVAVVAALVSASGLVAGTHLIGDQWAGNVAGLVMVLSAAGAVLALGLFATSVPVLRGDDPVARALRRPALEISVSLCGVLIAIPGVYALELAPSSPGAPFLISLAALALAALGMELVSALLLSKHIRLLLLPAALAALVVAVGLPRLAMLLAER